MKKIIFSIVSVFIIFSTNIGYAQQDSIKTKKILPRPPIYGIPAKTLPQGKFIYRSYFTFTNYSQMYSATKEKMIDLPSGMDFQNYSYTPKLRYGLTKRLTLIANFPLYYKQLKNGTITKKGVGFGDAVVAGLYKFYFNKKKHFLISGLLFSKYPTGKTNKLKSDELPLGSGTYDFGVAILPEKEFGKLDVRFSAFYLLRGENNQKVDLGNLQSYSISTAYNFSKNFIAETSILYKSTTDNQLNGNKITDSNTYLSQIIIGAQYRLAPTFLLQTAVPITLSSKIPFSSNYDVWFGIFYLM